MYVHTAAKEARKLEHASVHLGTRAQTPLIRLVTPLAPCCNGTSSQTVLSEKPSADDCRHGISRCQAMIRPVSQLGATAHIRMHHLAHSQSDIYQCMHILGAEVLTSFSYNDHGHSCCQLDKTLPHSAQMLRRILRPTLCDFAIATRPN